MALKHCRSAPGLLHHSDRGVQYASTEHRQGLVSARRQPSMSRAGNPYDNTAMESFMANCKRECVGLTQAAGGMRRARARRRIFSRTSKRPTTGSGATAPLVIHPLWSLKPR
ncbi:MAG: DDE-type integrase/transposase/recombinase [Verrucomicrobia bacterium]|nr:DDE-type integrase/transposase/recombinase [Verrucomicrobiota bacterium]